MDPIKLIIALLLYINGLHSLPTTDYENIDKLKASPENINNLSNNENQDTPNEDVEKVNVDQVIEEVQTLLDKNPGLPRLTRGEIVELLENITVEDSDTLKTQRGQKAIMLVMPYTPNNPNANMEELYTKPPVTKIIDGGKDGIQKGQEVPAFKPLKPIKSNLNLDHVIKDEDEKIFNQLQKELLSVETEEPQFAFSKETTTTLSQQFDDITQTTEKQIEKTTTITTAKPSTKRKITPKRRQYKTTTTTTSAPRTISSLELTAYTKSSETPKIRRRPPVTQKPLSIEEITYKPQHVHSHRRTTSSPEHHPNHKYPDEEIIENKASSKDAIRIVSPPKFTSKLTKKPEHAHKTVSSGYKTEVKPDDSVLESINIPENMKNIVKDIDILMQEDSKKVQQFLPNLQESKRVTSPSVLVTTGVPDVSEMADNLSPDMRELLMSFGLIPNPLYKPQPFKPQAPYKQEAEITRDSYVSFKPLPKNAPSREEMEELLAQFGLTGSNRGSKAIQTDNKNKNQLNFDVVPDSHKHILKAVGFKNEDELPVKKESQHVFKPKEKQTASPEELDRLEKLLDMIKQLEKLNGNVTDENLKDIDMKKLKDLVETFNKPESLDEKNAPNPINYDSGLSKNEVKRQQSSTSTTTTTEASSNPSISDLEASFGGVSETVSEATLPEPTTPKRTGFYYLVDWNSFFDIDNQKGKRVNLRFQPKVGDPRNFLSVTVP